MGHGVSQDSELIRVTLLDYFSLDVLIDKLVYPRVPLQHTRRWVSGVSFADLNNARHQGKCLDGRDAARREVWKYVGPQTIVVGHSAQSDLEALRMAHRTVVDTMVIEMQRIGAPKQQPGLKRLAALKLGRVIQNSKDGHDSKEDAMATRDLAHWTVLNGKT